MKFDLVIYLTNRCNLFCDHCDQSSGNPRENELTTSEILHGVEKLLKREPFEHLQFEIPGRDPENFGSMPGLELRHVCLSGGEPVLHKDFFYIANTLMDWGLKVSFVTNATFSPTYYSRILEIAFNEIYVSLDGLENTHNLLRRSGLSFKRVIQFLEFLNPYLEGTFDKAKRNFLPDLHIITCLTSKSVYDLDALSKMLSRYKINKWILKPLEMKGRVLEHAELVLDEAGKLELGRFLNSNTHAKLIN